MVTVPQLALASVSRSAQVYERIMENCCFSGTGEIYQKCLLLLVLPG